MNTRLYRFYGQPPCGSDWLDVPFLDLDRWVVWMNKLMAKERIASATTIGLALGGDKSGALTARLQQQAGLVSESDPRILTRFGVAYVEQGDESPS